ncbi:LysR family transcriptional regulator [Nonomuraea insulae]|uniref:LysR family transcriptional regulator n=1 Tax=Nonomuraea insulae TaxID=1616787 RepID=A0ABW1DB76_9ACTN
MTSGRDRFDLQSLRLLVAIGQRLSIGKAAADVGLSQPSASLRLGELERKIGVTLVERSPSGSRLTPIGKTVAGWARQVVDAGDTFVHSVRMLRDQKERRFTAVVSKTIADHLMPGWLVAMHAGTPDVTVALEVADPDTVVERVRTGGAGVGFVEGDVSLGGLRSRKIGDTELMVVVGSGHPLRGRAPLDLAGLAEIPLVLRESGCGSRAALEKALAAIGARPTVAVEMASTAAIKAVVAAGDGVTVLSSLAVASDVRTGRLVVLPLVGGPLRLPLHAVWHRGSQPVGPGRDLLAIATGVRGQVRPGNA